MDEEEDKKDGVGSGESDASDHVDSLRHADGVRRLLFTNLDETWLKEIILQINDDGEPKIRRCCAHMIRLVLLNTQIINDQPEACLVFVILSQSFTL